MSFPQYANRTIFSLNGVWSFKFIEEKNAPELKEFNPEKILCDDYQNIPGCFDSGIKYAGKRGIGVYKRSFNLTAGKYALKIGGMGLFGRFFLDNKEIGYNDLPYSGVSYLFDVKSDKKYEITLAIDNRFHKELIPIFYPDYDFYGFGGIYRDAELHKLPAATWLERCHVTTLDYKKGLVRLDVILGGKIVTEIETSISFDDGKANPYKLKFKDNKSSVELKVPSFKTWSPEAPNLHTVMLSLKNDAIIERFGIREVKTSKGEILLNGNTLKLHGYNRHEAHPEFGPALPLSIMIEDLQILKDMNCNFIRGCHYPQSQEFLDLCDQYGFMVWEESLGWGDAAPRLANKTFQKKQLEQVRLMVKNSYNHPSIITWGFLNEMHSFSEDARPITKMISDELRKLDSTRPITFATCYPEEDKTLEFVDIISFNIYPGWYGNNFEDVRPLHKIKPRLEELTKLVNKPEHKDKPWIISEIGAAGLFGCHDRLKILWSEDYQADYLYTVCEYFRKSKRMMGLALWQFMDCRSYACSPHLNRVRGFNNKGTLDEYRRPKLAYDVVKSVFSKVSKSK